MPFPRDVLNRVRWTEGDLRGVVITYLHRGAPEDRMSVRGEDIVELGRSFFVTADSKIPYHRIRVIERGGEVLYRERGENRDW
ncbi:MAG: RNA repair domain-containing protein [Methanomassiliicoccus sp.]|nr:RNA repair domain-containing protein [Methanomassiliicoccus sp.]